MSSPQPQDDATIKDADAGLLHRVVPQPYYSRDGITIYCGDCREILPFLGDFDAIVTDPPYGIADKWKGGAGGKSSWRIPAKTTHGWDGSPSDRLADALPHGREAIVWGGNYYALPPSRCWLIWDKKQNDKWTTGQAEMAWTNLDKTTRVFRMAQCEAHEPEQMCGKKVHPSQKPLDLMRWCLRWTDARTILDPFMGSGTTLVAAKLDGRQAVGIEVNEAYCEAAANRLRQGVLF